MNPSLPPAGWLPIHLRVQASPPAIDWAFLGERRFVEPFFEQSVTDALRHPARILFRRKTGLEALDPLADTLPDLSPSGFIFHVSRCGSTLVAQTLAADPHHVVLSEPPPVDQLLTLDAANPSLSLERRAARLRGLVHAYARRRSPAEARLFIKFDAWHTLHLPVIRAAFPDTPWLFLHRKPVEVLVSQRRLRGFNFIPGTMESGIFGIRREELSALSHDAYTARALHAVFEGALAALAAPGSRGMAIDYPELRNALPDLIRHHFNVPCDEDTLTAMQQVSLRNAKNPALRFEEDSARKRQEADPLISELAERWLDGPRGRLLAHAEQAARALRCPNQLHRQNSLD